jgi:uncharacterized protein (TIGR03435 family)
MKCLLGMLLIACAHCVCLAQATSQPPKFEVASVRQAAPLAAGAQTGVARSTGRGFMREDADRISYRGVTLKTMLLKAYGLEPFQISGPAWMDDEHYDVNATIPEGVPKEQVPLMLQNLLAERFGIAAHSEMKDEPVYALRVGKGGPKLKPSADNQRESMGIGRNAETGQEGLTYRAMTMARFAEILSRDLGRSVMDQTALDGKFDFSMQAESTEGSFAPLPSSLFAAVREIGLQLEPETAPIKHLIVDRALKVPTEN